MLAAAALLTLTTSVATLSHHPSWTVPKAPAACVTDGRNFIGCASAAHPNNVMSAINPANGSTEWQVPNQQPGAASGVTLRFCTTRPSDAFLGSSAGQWSETVSAVDKMTGAVGWSFATAPSTVQCSLRGDIVYLPTSAVLFALDATTGASRWSQPVNDADGYHVVEVADSRDNSTTTSLIFVDTVGAHRLDGCTGEVLSFALSMDVGDIPIGVVGRVVLFQKANTSVVATTADGHAVWWWLVGFVPVQSFVQLHGDVLMFGETNDNVVEAINATTGKRLWTRPVDMNNAPTLAAVNDELLILSVAGPLLQNNTLYSYASWEAVSLATGELRWALHNVTTGCVYSFATANYFGVTNNAGDAIVAFKVADGTNRTLPIGNACTTDGPSLAMMETDNLLVVQNASIAIAYSRW